MNRTRRCVVQGALFAATAAVVPALSRAAAAPGGFAADGEMAPPAGSTIVYDSRQAQSSEWRLRYQRRPRYLQSHIDIAGEHANYWSTLRGTALRGRVVGLTAWSDLVLVRGFLEEKGLRLRTERRCERLFYWEMA
ncbi:MAG TPA: hypothetical protein VKP66_11685 [Steroidobacteraceae bacterium]|nr:hypothetical protein [Steroidobacteraceae bacterium]